jgi:hypothetical protein
VLESEFLRALLSALSAPQRTTRVWRQNVGYVRMADGRFFHAGPPPGAADLSGWIAPEGWRLEVEAKAARGRSSVAQMRFAAALTAAGGVYVLVAYDEARSLRANVAAGVDFVDRAIAARRST